MTIPTTSLASVIESAQCHPDGSPRFRVACSSETAAWREAAAVESGGGVSGDIRIFLDAQLEAGDVLIDAAPGLGFVALSAVTAPQGMPSVFALNTDDDTFSAIADSARDAGGWVEAVSEEMLQGCQVSEIVSERLPLDGRAFVHCNAAMLPAMLEALTPLIVLGRVVACCLSVPHDADHPQCDIAAHALDSHGFVLHALGELHGEPQLFSASDLTPGHCFIAIATMATAADVAGDVFGDISAIGNALLAAEEVTAQIDVTDHESSIASFVEPAVTNAFSFIAPFCRTGYGIVGAHLLREFLHIDMPVAYFPLGAMDRSIVRIPDLDRSIERQGTFEDSAPSVRLSQQFDLAMHVGRGPRIGFPIFELDKFHSNERHHLERQDRLLVTSVWARNVLLENGIWRTPIDIVPLGVDRSVFHEHVRSSAAPTRDTVFMSVGKLEPRKGQRELLQAFEAAFAPSDPVRLVLVCHNPFVDSATHKALLKPFQSSRMASRISLITAPFATQADLALQMMAADCAVFPVRAEGWNLEALEMLSLGKHVIASDCTAHTAFLTNENARLIAIDAMEESVPGDTRGRWAAWGERQREQLVEHLRTVHARRQHGDLAVNAAGIHTAMAHSWSASANAVLQSVASA